MKFPLLALSCIACAPSKTLATYARTNKLSSRSLSELGETYETCTAVMIDIQFEHNEDVFEAPIDHHSIECFTSDGIGHSVPSADEDFIHKNFIKGDFISGETDIIIFESEMQKNGTSKPVFSSPPVLIKKITPVEETSGNGRKLDVTGDFTVLAIRVVLSDGQTTANENTVRDGIFGNNVNLRSQYSDCSHDQLNFDSVGTVTGDSLTINDGVITINLPNSRKSDGNTAIRNAINSAFSADFGASVNQIADYVMYCLPSGTFSGIAFAGVNSWYSVYSNEWCGYSAVQMHEVGHNINLAHAGDGSNQYGDQSGNMGYSYREANTLMCFNAAKSWQLGWYSDSAVTIDAVANRSYEGEVASIIEDPFTVQVPILIKLNTPSGNDYFVNFNRKTDFNSGTKEGGNQVMITKAGSEGNSYSQSWLESKLSANGSWVSPAVFNGETVTVTVISIGTARANVKICVGTCPSTTPAPVVRPTSLPPPTFPPTSRPPPTLPPRRRPTPSPVVSPTSPPPTSSPPTPSPVVSPTSLPPTSSPVGLPTWSPLGSPTLAPNSIDCAAECYENPGSIFLLKVKNKAPVYETCEDLAERSVRSRKKICKRERKSRDGFGPASVHCRVTCSEWKNEQCQP